MNIIFSRSDGTDLYSGTIKYELGQIITAPDCESTSGLRHGFHFGDPGINLTLLSETPGKAFEVEPIGQVMEISPIIKKARSLKILRELNLPRLLSRLAEDENRDVRLRVAEHPSTSQRTLSKLVKDKSWRVRDAARENLSQRKKWFFLIKKPKVLRQVGSFFI